MEQTNIPELEAIHAPIFALKAALSCVGNDETRYYLKGVFVHAHEDRQVRLVATDGHRMFVYAIPAQAVGGNLPKWLGPGVIVPAELLKERLALIEKLENSTAVIAYQTAASHVVLADPADLCRFKLSPVDGTFPDYNRILDTLNVFEGGERPDMASVSYNPDYLKGVGGLAKLLGAKSAQLYASDPEKPSLVTFPDCDGALLVLMPILDRRQITAQTATVVSGAVSGTIAALKAHRTRWVDKLDTASDKEKLDIDAKIADYDRRIAAIIEQTQAPALPKPSETPEPEGDHPDETKTEEIPSALATPSYAIAEAAGPEPETKVVALPTAPKEPDPDGEAACDKRSRARGRLRGNGRKRAELMFRADVNAVLSAEHGGLTVEQLADGVPLDQWFYAGIRPAAAAVRCLDWRKIEAVLPPDEVGPNEGDEPCGHLTTADEELLAAE